MRRNRVECRVPVHAAMRRQWQTATTINTCRAFNNAKAINNILHALARTITATASDEYNSCRENPFLIYCRCACAFSNVVASIVHEASSQSAKQNKYLLLEIFCLFAMPADSFSRRFPYIYIFFLFLLNNKTDQDFPSNRLSAPGPWRNHNFLFSPCQRLGTEQNRDKEQKNTHKHTHNRRV